MKSNKLSLLLLLGTMLFTYQKGILNDHIDLTWDWEWKPQEFDCPCYMIYSKSDTTCNFGGPLKKQISIQTQTNVYENERC